MRSEEERVKLTLTKPEEMRQNNKAKNILLYYKDFMDYYICVIVKLGFYISVLEY
jgi:hypothetical protein